MVDTHAGGRLRQGSVTVVRRIAAGPERVFQAFADPALRRRWFRLPGEPGPVPHELELRPGGHERATATFSAPGQREEVAYDAHVLDVVPGRRIVFAYAVSLDGRTRTAALVTVDLAAAGDGDGDGARGTDVTYTEQYTLIDVSGDGERDAAHPTWRRPTPKRRSAGRPVSRPPQVATPHTGDAGRGHAARRAGRRGAAGPAPVPVTGTAAWGAVRPPATRSARLCG